MKKNLQLIAFTFVAMFLFANSGIAQFAAQKLDHPVSVPADKQEEGVWIHYDSGESDNALGLSDGAIFQSAIRWEPADLADFDGMVITSIRVYINDLPDAASVIIYQGADDASLEQKHFQAYEPVAESWNEIILDSPVTIDASLELWVSSQVDDAGDGLFSSGMDTTIDDAVGYGNMVNLGTGWDILTDLADIPGVFSLQAFVEPASPDENYMVTFRVNMSPALLDGFDPAEHNVVVTGDFAGWTEPGQEGSVELTQESPAKEDVVILEEGFEGEVFPPDGWAMLDEDGDGNLWFAYAAENSAHTGEGSAASASWFDGTVLTPDNWLMTPALNIDNDSYMLEFYVAAQDPDWAAEKYAVMISTTDTEPASFTNVWEETLVDDVWNMREVDLSEYAGEQIYIAFRHYDVSDMFYIKIDDVKVYGAGDPQPDDVFYSATVEIPAGDIAYKYFSNAFGEGWEGGEWEAGDDRTATIDADVTLNDIWADPGTSVDNILAETGLNMFPNPVRNTLYVENTVQINEVRIYDLTGRLIMSQVVNNNTASVNVSEFNRGVYIMQVVSENGVASQKFNVIK